MNEVRPAVRHQQLCGLGLVRAVPHIDVKLRGLKQLKNVINKLQGFLLYFYLETSVADPDPNPDPPDPHVFGPPGSGSFYHHAKSIRKTLIPTILRLFLTFYLWKMM
jgi:hypothetical protein